MGLDFSSSSDAVGTLDFSNQSEPTKLDFSQHSEPISPVQQLNKTEDVWSQPDTLANVVTAAITGGKKALGLADKYLLQPAEQLPYSALNLLTFHKPTDPYAKQVLETPLLPSHPEKSLAGTDLATEYNKNLGVPDRMIGALPVVGESIRSLTTPENLMAAGAGLIKGGAQPIVSAFLGKTLEQLPEQVKQAVITESDPKSTDEQKGAAWAQAGISAGFGGLLTHGLMKTGITPTTLGPDINRDAGIVRDKTFGDLPVNAPVDKPTDQILDTRAQLPEKAGPSQPQSTRFNAGMPGSEAPIDRSQLSPLKLQELDRGPNPQYVAPKEKTMETPIIGEHPLAKPLVDLSIAVADLQKALIQQQIQPANQAVTRARDVEGGQVSFASPATGDSIPNAQQSVITPKEATVTPEPQPVVEPTFDQKKQALVNQLKAEPTPEGKQKIWQQIESLKNSRPQEAQAVEVTLPGLRVKLDAAAKKRQGQAGGIDMSILEDVVKFGKTLYTKGMDKAQWTQEAVGKLGENVRPYIDEAWKNIPVAMQQRGDKTFALQAEQVLSSPMDLKLKPDGEGKFNSEQLIGRTLNSVSPGEKEFLEQQGIRKAFAPGTKVSREEVRKWVEENGPKVEVRKFGEAMLQSPAAREFAQLVHWKDSLADEQQSYLHLAPQVIGGTKKFGDLFKGEDLVRAKRYLELKNDDSILTGERAHWSSIAPKPESDMPGYVEGAVVIPVKEGYRGGSPINETSLLGKNHKESGVLFPSTHSFPPNTLGFFRGYMDKTPEGKKVFHVVEVQSDWAQQRRNWEQQEPNKKMGEPQNHPLLHDWSRLTLKAAIDHAIKEGADEIAVSDAETAMMTEGHDLYRGGDFARGIHDDTLKQVEEQFGKGMRLNYNRILPTIASELTGEKGRKVELGEHKMAFVGGLRGPFEDPYRKDLIFQENGKPKTSITANSFDLSKVKESIKTKPFSFFGSDKPKVPTREQVATKLQPTKSIGTGIKAAVEKNKEAGMVTLPSKEEMGKALETAKAIPGRILDSIIGHSVDRPIDEIVNHIISKQQGWSAPRHVAVNEEVGNKLVKYASADIAADQYAKALASEALGDHYKDKTFQNKLGKVIVEERLRALAKHHQDKNETELASSVTHVMSPTEFDTALKDPEIKAAVERHKAIVQPVAEEQHTSLGGKLAATGPNTGAFANLLAVTDADNFDTAKQLIYGKGNVNPRATVKGSVFEKHATGQAPKYETNYRTVAERMISGNYKRNALRNWIDAGVEAGIYKYAKPGETIPEMGGQPMTSVPVRIKATPWGSEVTKNLWVRKDLMPEVSQALSGGEKPMKAGMQLLTDLATEAQLIGPTDFVFHTANMYASIVGSLGAKTVTRDVARKLTGVKQLDALGRIGYNIYRAILDHPETQKELADIARIGALRDQSQRPTLLAKATGGVLDTAKFIRVIDKAGRLARNKMFDNLVERGWVTDTEVDRREFINKMGQYNAKLMSHFQDIAQKYTSQFVVAGRTFNRNAFQRVLMSNEVRAANPSAYWKMKALNMIGVASTLLVVPVIANSLISGKPFGRPGTPVGKVDSGTDDEHGRHITYDPAQSELMRRGLRITGGQALFEGVRENKPPTEVMKKMVGDIINGQLNPWQGPPVRVVKGYIEKQAQTHDVGESLKAALAAVNPTITAFMGMDERNDKKGVAGVGQSLEGAVGVGKTRMPTHEEALENVASKYTMPLSTLKDRSNVEKKIKETRPAKTPEEMTSAAKYSIDADARRGSELRKGMDKADLDFVSRRGFEVPGYRDAVNYRGQTVVLKPTEAETLKGLYQASDKMVIDKFKSGRWDNKPPQIQKEIFSELITIGREKARAQMIKQMRAVQ